MSNSPKVERKLAAIMFTDIAGYTESMSYDEQQAITAVKKKRSIIQPLIKEYNGVFVKEIGDGTLSYFSSAIDASTCAVKLQELTYDEEHLNIRVGLHIGDIVFDGQDVFGEGVNIASRLESLSPVGGVCVSKNVYDELENKKEFDGTSLGLQSLKGVGRLVEVYALKGDKLREPDTAKYKETEVKKHTDDEVPSIAIIPFENKGAEEDVFYAYGISADLISDCSKISKIKVASLNRIEDLGNKTTVDKAKILNVRYTVEGTLWKMGNMFQLSIELYDTKDTRVVWSDRWQEKWENLSNIKNSISEALLKALDKTQNNYANHFDQLDPGAYEYYLKAKYVYTKRKTPEDKIIAIDLLEKALELDENIYIANILKANIAFEDGDLEKAIALITNVLHDSEKRGDNENIMKCLSNFGYYYNNASKYEKAIPYLNRCISLSSKLNDEHMLAVASSNLSFSLFQKKRIEEALIYINKSIDIYFKNDKRPDYATAIEMKGKIYEYRNDYDSALNYYFEANKIFIENENTWRILSNFDKIGNVYNYMGKYKKSLFYYKESYSIVTKLEAKHVIYNLIFKIGDTYLKQGKYKKAFDIFRNSLEIQKELPKKKNQLKEISLLYLTYKYLDKKYDKNDVYTIIKETEIIEFELNFRLYELLEDNTYLKTAFNQIQEKIDAMDDDLGEKFLNYPIQKQIIEEYNKVFN